MAIWPTGAEASEAGPIRVLGRGAARRCGRCGSGGLFERWLTMQERCPGCGLRFERDEGFFLGAYVMNFAAAGAVVAVVLGVVIALEANNPAVALTPVLVVGAVAAVLTPVVCYPYSRTLWTAIELVMKPLEPAEVADAAAHAGTGLSSRRGTPRTARARPGGGGSRRRPGSPTVGRRRRRSR